MNTRSYLPSRQIRILTASLLLVAVAAVPAWAASESPGNEPVQGTITIATGTDNTVDGFLSVGPDDFGQWASLAGFGGGGDIFNPAGAFGPMEPTFSSALFLFVPSRSQRSVLTDNPNYLAIGSDGSLTLTVTSPLAASDTNADTVDDTLVSSFSATGTDTNLAFDLTQTVVSGDPGVAILTQTYVITNNAAMSIDCSLARVYDGDLLWAGNPGDEFSNDEVGTTTNGAGGDTFVFEQEPGDSTTAITVSSAEATSYFGGKHGVNTPPTPPFDFGTDTEIFDAFGLPAEWVNLIAGVGYDTDGVSGPTPPGSVNPEDGFCGLGFPLVTLGPGESTTVTIQHTYGQNTPATTGPIVPNFDIEIPTLGQTGLIALAVFLVVLGLVMLRRRRQTTAL